MTAYLSELSDDFITINADDTTDRRSRASQISALKRRQEKESGVTLTLISKSYSETPGFLSRSSFRYTVTRPVVATPAQVLSTEQRDALDALDDYATGPSLSTLESLGTAVQAIKDTQHAPAMGDDDRQRWFKARVFTPEFHALTSGHAACSSEIHPLDNPYHGRAYTVDDLPDSARPCDACNAVLRAYDDTPVDWVAALEIPASPDACACRIPSRANFYASGVILGDDFTEELSDYLCTDHAPGHRASVKETLGHGERLVQYKQASLR